MRVFLRWVMAESNGVKLGNLELEGREWKKQKQKNCKFLAFSRKDALPLLQRVGYLPVIPPSGELTWGEEGTWFEVSALCLRTEPCGGRQAVHVSRPKCLWQQPEGSQSCVVSCGAFRDRGKGEAELLSCPLKVEANRCQCGLWAYFLHEGKGMVNYQLGAPSWSCFRCFF